MKKIYRAPLIESIITFYGDLLEPQKDQSIFEHLTLLSHKMHEGIRLQKDCIYSQINNYHSQYLGTSISKLKEINLELEDCQHTIANEYSYKSWNEVIDLDHTLYNIEFEQCVTSILKGDMHSLRDILRRNPSLIHSHSQFGHNAALLHYCASNGVEFWRQQVPYNLPDVVQLLLDMGADKTAKMKVYGGQFTALELLVTSAHPHQAGLVNVLSKMLVS